MELKKERVKGKKQICLFVNEKIFKEFRKLCIDEEISYNKKIEQLMMDSIQKIQKKEEVAKN